MADLAKEISKRQEKIDEFTKVNEKKVKIDYKVKQGQDQPAESEHDNGEQTKEAQQPVQPEQPAEEVKEQVKPAASTSVVGVQDEAAIREEVEVVAHT